MTAAPTTARGRRSRERIVDAAALLFFERGVAATGLNDIASASGTGKGQLYHYFEGKPDLVRAVARHQGRAVVDAQRPLLAELRTADDLRAWAAEAVAAHEQGRPPRCPIGSLVVELTGTPDAPAAELADTMHEWRQLLAEGIARLQRTAEARSDRRADDLADLLLCAYEGGIVVSAARGETAPLRTALDLALEAVLR